MIKLTKKNYVDRDVSWMHFNHRILEEAQKESVPVLERLSFLGIYSNNLDEFFRVRMASLNRIALCKDKGVKKEIDEAHSLLKQLNSLNSQYAKEYQSAVEVVMAALRNEHINVIDENHIDEEQRAFILEFYRKNLIGRVSPTWVENIKHFDNEADDTIYLIVKMNKGGKKTQYAILPLPTGACNRFVRLPDKEEEHYIMYLDDVVRVCLPMVFPGMDYDNYEAYSFKFTRDAEMEIDNDLRNGFLQKISKGVKSRKQGEPLRLVYDRKMPGNMLRKVTERLNGNGKLDTALAGGKYQNHRDLMSFPSCGRNDLKFPEWPAIRKSDLNGNISLFKLIREKDRFIHVPYHSFDGYIRLLNEAAIDPKVKTIKTTLYRLAKDSKVIRALICAALNGKKVTVIIELLARFDEASNIDWSKKMQDAGINVIFGVEGLKVHSKITHIGFATGQSIAVVSTGNFHEGNASRYTDVLMMTANKNITHDVDSVFQFIEKPYYQVKFKELLVSPNEMKKKFLSLIDNEIKNHLQGKPAWIKMKVNHITEPMMVSKIYDAVESGVRVDALVRGNCSLVDNEAFDGRLKVVGIIDRYLEHSRIFVFANGGEPLYFIGSADWMPRNLDCRVEVVAPVFDKSIQSELMTILDFGLKDTKQGRVVIGKNDNDQEFSHRKNCITIIDYEKRDKSQ